MVVEPINTGIEAAIMPFKVQQLVELIMQQKQMNFADAFFYLYSTDCYRLMLQPDTKLWYMSGLSLLDMIEEEKQRSNESDSKLLLFFSFCLERYKDRAGISAADALNLFLQRRVFDFLRSSFDMLHTQGENYIMEDIEDFLRAHDGKVQP